MTTPGEGPTAQLLSIGSELLAGETTDTNATFVGGELGRLGIPISGIRTLPDDRPAIAAAFAELRRGSDLLVATGGLGPTHDDLDRKSVV